MLQYQEVLASQQEEGELFGFFLVVELKVPSSSRFLVLVIGQQLDKVQ